jgi:hypothetical protein
MFCIALGVAPIRLLMLHNGCGGHGKRHGRMSVVSAWRGHVHAIALGGMGPEVAVLGMP